jgi:hypothetical protein
MKGHFFIERLCTIAGEESLSEALLNRAESFALKLPLLVKDSSWLINHVARLEGEEIWFEFWGEDPRKLSIQVDQAKITYIKVWGINMETEMEDGVLKWDSMLDDLFNWLYAAESNGAKS